MITCKYHNKMKTMMGEVTNAPV